MELLLSGRDDDDGVFGLLLLVLDPSLLTVAEEDDL